MHLMCSNDSAWHGRPHNNRLVLVQAIASKIIFPRETQIRTINFQQIKLNDISGLLFHEKYSNISLTKFVPLLNFQEIKLNGILVLLVHKFLYCWPFLQWVNRHISYTQETVLSTSLSNSNYIALCVSL